jgi:hypothetical protein
MTQEPNQELLEVDSAQTNSVRDDLALYFLRLAILGFGGPIAFGGHRALVRGRVG